jgi:ERF superfamily
MTSQAVIIEHQEDRPPLSEANALLATVSKLATDPRINVDVLERVVRLYESVKHNQAEAAFNAAMAMCQAELPQVLKDASNSQTHSKYATLDAIGRQIDPVIARHGFALSFEEAESTKPDHIRVACLIRHKDGHTHLFYADVPTDAAGLKGTSNKTRTHAWGSTLTYARRYLTMLAFNLKQTGDRTDDDGNGATRKEREEPEDEFIDMEQIKDLLRLANQSGADMEQFYKWLGVESLSKLTQSRFGHARSGLLAKLAQKKKTLAQQLRSSLDDLEDLPEDERLPHVSDNSP